MNQRSPEAPELYLFSVAVSGPRAMSGPPQGGPVVVKVSSGIHLMLSKSRTSASVSSYPNCTSESTEYLAGIYLKYEELGSFGFSPGLL